MRSIIKAPAKINLFLSINGKRDDGYHDLTMIMQPISLFDTLEIEIINYKNRINNDSDNQINLLSNWAFIPTDDKNLVVKVIKYFFEKYSIYDKIFVYLKKMIPACGGLGGGSSDAASMILFLNEYYKTNLSLDEMNNIACMFGSDIPFFLYKKECICEGRGEIITQLTSFKKYYLLIVTPNLRVSTKDIFNAVDDKTFKKGICENKIDLYNNCINAIKNRNIISLCSNLYNELEFVTCELYSDVKYIKNFVLELGAKAALMSGSGPTVFGIYDSYFKVLNAKNKIKSKFRDAFSYIARPIY